MLEYLIYFVFILSVAFTACGVIISNKLRSRFKYDFLSTLLYFQVFIFTFGFYGLWGQVIISAFMKDYLSAEVLGRISDIAILLGLPFLVFAWLMLFRLSRDIGGKRNRKWLIILFLIFNFANIFIFGFVITKHPEIKTVTLLKYYFITFNFIYCIIASANIFLSKKITSNLRINNKGTIASSIILTMLIQDVLLYSYTSDNYYIALAFIFSFFAGNAFLPLYLSYGNCFSIADDKSFADITFEQFFTRFDVSPRERDIIREIIKGLSNKEIADKLFISLQTVKDHTHRIYIKTNVRSRVQLINLLRDIKS
jgi:DNA-binding CsgD family transcriptional regulator